jgi:hypothetical protein
MNAPTVTTGKKNSTKGSIAQKPSKGADYVVAAPSHEDNSLSIIMSVSHSTIEY